MASFLEIVRRNLPAAKPQLWENLPRAVARRAVLETRRRLGADWARQPHVVTILGGDERLEVVPSDAIGRGIFLYGTYELAVTRFLQGVLPKGGVFIDVGANVGYHAVVAAKAVGSGGAVHAFEPVDALRERLLKNVRLNRLDNVTVRNEAVWSRSGSLSFFVDGSPDNSGLSSAIPREGSRVEKVTVEATTLDDVASRLDRPISVVKIDVEGGEKEVLQGASGLLGGRARPALLFESFDVPPVARLLSDAGYEVKLLDYSFRRGLALLPVGREAARASAAYEPPNYAAIPRGWGGGSWGDIAGSSRARR